MSGGVAGQKEPDRDALVGTYLEKQAENDRWIYEQVVHHGRLDVLAREVLGYEVARHHLALMVFMARNPHSLHLAFRGSGKSTCLTVCGVILDILQDPNTRICIASKVEGHSSDILTEIKGHFETNEKFRRIFGDMVGEKWNETEIVISTRNRPRKEPTVFAVGIGGQVVGKHFDHVYCDDLVDEPNTRTPLLRERTKTWYYIQLHPTFEPHCHVHIIGTRYHYDDLYGYLEKNDLKGKTQIIRALDDQGRTPWPEKYSREYMENKRKTLGIIIFNSQFQCDTEAMKGGIFRWDWFDFVEPEDVPDNVIGYVGADLAIKKKESNDKYADVGIGITSDGHVYVLTSYTARLGFRQQTERLTSVWEGGCDGWFEHGGEGESRLVEIGVENVAYQDAQLQVLQEDVEGIRVVGITTIQDKYTRAVKLSARFEQGKVHFVGRHPALVEQLLLFQPGIVGDDLFDALDHAVTTAFRPNRRNRKKRSRPVGVIGGGAGWRRRG